MRRQTGHRSVGCGVGVLVLAGTVLLSSCTADGTDSSSDRADPEPTESVVAETFEAADVTTIEETLVDDSRPTDATAFSPATPERTIQTHVAFPEPAGGRLPLVVLAHGLGGNPGKLTELATAWAQAGYVVALPRFPLSTDDKPGGSEAADFADVVNQPADVSFVLDELLRLDGDRNSDLYQRIDAEHIGLAGHSLGGMTAYGTVYDACCRDDRVDATVLLAAVRDIIPFPGGGFEARPVPALLVVADGDFAYEQSTAAYPLLAAPKWMITLHGGDVSRHSSPYENAPDPADDLVEEATVAFWDLWLEDQPDAEARLEDAAQPADGSATLQTQRT